MQRVSRRNLTKLVKGPHESGKITKALYLLVLLACLVPFYLSRAQATHRVVIEGMQFKPLLIRAHVGDTIVWSNVDLVAHTVTASDKSFDSGLIGANAEWSLLLRKQGEIHYTCTVHPQMNGTIVVE